MPSIFRVGCSERWVEAMSAKLEELNSQFLFFVPLASCFWQLNSRHNYKLGFDILRRYLDNNDRWQGKRWRLINCRQGVLASSALALYRTTNTSITCFTFSRSVLASTSLWAPVDSKLPFVWHFLQMKPVNGKTNEQIWKMWKQLLIGHHIWPTVHCTHF